MTKRKVLHKKEYLDSGGIICPYCFSEDIMSGGGVIMDGPRGYQNVMCRDCSKEWQDVITLTDVEEVQL